MEETSLAWLCVAWRNIKGFTAFSVMIMNSLASSERLTQVCGGQALHAPKTSLQSLGSGDAHLPVAIWFRVTQVLCAQISWFLHDSAREIQLEASWCLWQLRLTKLLSNRTIFLGLEWRLSCVECPCQNCSLPCLFEKVWSCKMR